MNVDEFYDMLPREFWNKIEGFRELENMRQRSDWERTRWSTCLLLNIQLPKNKSIKPTDLIEFDWEKRIKKKHSQSEYQKVQYLIAKANKKNKNG